VPWQNPQTGVGGNITPLASSHSEGGFPCRDFLASYVRGRAQSWLQGSACRTASGEWQVKSLKPLKSS
jgi:surface antigen